MKPEKLVQREILNWALLNRWSLDVVDSKCLIGKNGRLQKNPGIPTGTPDVVGNSDNGLAVYVELKAPGKESVCRESQYHFLVRKIESGAFGIVTSSAAHLAETYHKWISLRSESKEEACKYLLSQLPKKLIIKGRIIALKTS